MKYDVLTVDSVNWNKIEKAEINSYVWGKEYVPHAYAQLALIKEKGIALKMTAYEIAPKAVYNKYNDPVYKDSCLEFFVSFNSESPYYMNFEINSNGAFLAAIRTERKNKTPIDKIVDLKKIEVKPYCDEEKWSVEVLFTFDVIEALFGKCNFKDGAIFRGNFYKCGDETTIPHFGSWATIKNARPDFHRPEFFGIFEIK
ncbi:MAG: carbohydrate-binding family 9-like protein [Clostridia bacterium]